MALTRSDVPQQQVCLPVDGMSLASDVKPLFFEDFIAINGKLFADVTLPFNKDVETGYVVLSISDLPIITFALPHTTLYSTPDTDHSFDSNSKVNVIIVKGTAILLHFHVAMMYFPYIFNSDVTHRMREDYDALTVATLLLAFYHNDGKGLIANAAVAVNKTKLRELFQLWLELNPQLDDFLIASVWDTLDECVFSA